MSACFDSSTSTSRGFVFAGSLPSCEMKPVFETLKWRAALVDFLARLVLRERRPFGHGIEVRRNLEQRIEHQRPGLGDGLLHRQHADEVIADAEVIALGFDVGVDHLVVEKLRVLRLARNPPVVVVEQPAKETELALLVQNLDCTKSASWRANAWTRCSSRARSRSIWVRSSVFMLLLVNCVFNSFTAPAGSRNSRARAGRRRSSTAPFKDDAVVDFDLVELVCASPRRTAAAGRWPLVRQDRRSRRTESPAGST